MCWNGHCLHHLIVNVHQIIQIKIWYFSLSQMSLGICDGVVKWKSHYLAGLPQHSLSKLISSCVQNQSAHSALYWLLCLGNKYVNPVFSVNKKVNADDLLLLCVHTSCKYGKAISISRWRSLTQPMANEDLHSSYWKHDMINVSLCICFPDASPCFRFQSHLQADFSSSRWLFRLICRHHTRRKQ